MQQALRRYRADLHIHTALSPCASEAMTPPAILTAARRRRINVIGVVDHNAAGNARAMIAAAECRGPESTYPDPAIAFWWLYSIDAYEDTLYACDRDLCRIVKVRMEYRETKEAAVE